MKNSVLLLVAFMAFSLQAFSQTIVTGAMSELEFCPGEETEITYTATGAFNDDNVFIAQISSNNFVNFRNFGNLKSTVSGSFSITIPKDLSPGDNYRIRVISSSPYITGSDNGENIIVLKIPNNKFYISMKGEKKQHTDCPDWLYLVGEKIQFRVLGDSTDYTSPEWYFGEEANTEIVNAFQPDSITFTTDGYKKVLFSLNPLSRCGTAIQTESQEFYTAGCDPKIDTNSIVISTIIDEWPNCMAGPYWILPTGSINKGYLLGASIYIETGGNLSVSCESCRIYLKPGASYTGSAFLSTMVVSPGSSINPAYYTIGSNKILDCSQMNFNYSMAPPKGIQIMIDLGYLDPTDVKTNVTSDAKSQLFPNPANDLVNIRLNGDLRSVSVMSVLGVEMLAKEFSGESGMSTIDVSGLHPGVYFVKYRFAGGAERVEKLVIER